MQDKLSRSISKMLNQNPAVASLIAKGGRKKNTHKALGEVMASETRRLVAQRKKKSLPGQMDLF